MIRRFNYTDRLRILREDVEVKLHQNGSRFSFDATFDLADYDLPEDALVFVEAYRQTSWMRFGYGTVGAVTAPADRELSEFDSPEDIRFRVKVTQASDTHVLLAEADRIPLRRPEDGEDKRAPLLPVKGQSLGEEIYRVDFSDDKPRLLVNKDAGDWRAIAKSPAFASLVYPAVFREILARILMVNEFDDSSDGGNWRSMWLKFAEALPGVESCPDADDEDACSDWIDAAVQAFATKLKNLLRFGEYWKKEDV